MQLTAHQRARLRSHRQAVDEQRRRLSPRRWHPVFYVLIGATYAGLLGLLGYGAVQMFTGTGGV